MSDRGEDYADMLLYGEINMVGPEEQRAPRDIPVPRDDDDVSDIVDDEPDEVRTRRTISTPRSRAPRHRAAELRSGVSHQRAHCCVWCSLSLRRRMRNRPTTWATPTS